MPESQFCCPRCHGCLDARTERYECRSCASVYPIIVGIPDFRVYPDPYISLEADRDKGRDLAEMGTKLSFAELVARYYAITPEVTPHQAQRFQAHHLAGVTRGEGLLARLAQYDFTPPSGVSNPWLDLGCGTAGFVAAAAATGGAALGVDIAFRWLVIGRQRLIDLGLDSAPLVCACADYLPFPDDSFAVIVAENLLEHTHDASQVLHEIARVRRPGAAVLARTVNRYALAPEPHVGLWGVGFLPRRLMDPYVRWRRGLPYKHIMLHSLPSLRRIVRSTGQRDLQVHWPKLLSADYHHHSPKARQLFTWYARLSERVPSVRPMLTLFGPYLDIISQHDSV